MNMRRKCGVLRHYFLVVKATTLWDQATCKRQRSNTWFLFPQQQTQSLYSYTNMNATIQKWGWMEKRTSPRKSGVLRQIATHSNLSVLHKACIINFFPSPEKKKKCFSHFQMAALLPWLGSSIDRAIHPSRMYVSGECKWQLSVYAVTKGPQKVRAMEQQCESLSVKALAVPSVAMGKRETHTMKL